jgi:FKBP-type peptidyl-prolyl cis-trans isomerase
MKTEMNVIQGVFLITTLLALDVAAQPAPPPRPAPAMPPSLTRPATNEPPPVMPDKDKLSYAIGMNIASSFKSRGLEVDVDTLATAIKDVLGGKPTRFTDAEVRATLDQYMKASRAKMMAEQEAERQKGLDFLAKNAKADGVKSLTNGLEYKVIKEGAGPMPASNDIVTVSYKGTLIDGTTFDENTNFTTPIVGRTIKGWSEILPLMKVGSEWEVTVPSNLGYGPRGRPPKIGPNAVLIFDMTLLSNAPAPPPPHPAATAGGPPAPPAGTTSTPVVSGQIIKVPSAEELKKGAKIEVITNVPNQ